MSKLVLIILTKHSRSSKFLVKEHVLIKLALKQNSIQVPLTISSKYKGINSHQLEEFIVLREGEIVFVCKGFIVKHMKNFETKNAETICVKLVIDKKRWCIVFAYQPPDTNKIYITLNKILGTMTTFS